MSSSLAFQVGVGLGLGQTRLTDVVVRIVLVVVGALGSSQEVMVRTGLGVVLQETVVVVTIVTRYVVYWIRQLELEGRIRLGPFTYRTSDWFEGI